MTKARIAVGVDGDNTMWDTFSRIKEYFRQEYQVILKTDSGINFTDSGLSSFTPKMSDDEITDIIWNKDCDKIFVPKLIKPISGVFEFLEELRRRNLDIIVCTANPNQKFVRNWVLEWDRQLLIPKVEFTWNKYLLPIEFLLDDDFRFIKPFLQFNKVGILMIKNYNKDIKEGAWKAIDFPTALFIIDSQLERIRRKYDS